VAAPREQISRGTEVRATTPLYNLLQKRVMKRPRFFSAAFEFSDSTQ